MAIKTIEEKIDKVWDELFDFICETDDDIYELKIEYQSRSTGVTVKRSWLDREKRLSEGEYGKK